MESYRRLWELGTRWWGPKGFTVRVARLDLRPGGVFHYGLQSPDGQEMWDRAGNR